MKVSPNHGPLYKALGNCVELSFRSLRSTSTGEVESKCGHFHKAREIFQKGLELDPQCVGLYHGRRRIRKLNIFTRGLIGAALLEARLGNIDGLAELHKRCKLNFGCNSNEFSDDIIARIGAMEHAVKIDTVTGLGGHALDDDNELHGYNLGDQRD